MFLVYVVYIKKGVLKRVKITNIKSLKKTNYRPSVKVIIEGNCPS